MTDLKARLAGLLEGITPGSWEIYACPIESAQQAKDELAYQIDHTNPVGPSLYLINANGKCPAATGCGPTSEANARLIAAAPEAIAEALARIERLESAMRECVAAMRDYIVPDGIGADEFASRVIGALDNPNINPIIRELDNER